MNHFYYTRCRFTVHDAAVFGAIRRKKIKKEEEERNQGVFFAET